MEWDNRDIKESHPNKTLSQHIKEVRDLYTRIASFYNIPDQINSIMNEIIEYHDVGKLNKEWNVNNKKNPPHAEYSIRYLKEHNINENLKSKYGREITILIVYLNIICLYMIGRHHMIKNYETYVN